MTEKHGTDLLEMLAKRKIQHGNFTTHAQIEVALKKIASIHSGRLTDIQVCALGMIFHKIARILNGGQKHSDTWQDIAGYATLAEQSILNE